MGENYEEKVGKVLRLLARQLRILESLGRQGITVAKAEVQLLPQADQLDGMRTNLKRQREIFWFQNSEIQALLRDIDSKAQA